MFGGRLNPHANSFIPTRKSEALREIALKSVAELFEKKKANGEKTVTNQEIAKLVGHFISIGYKELTDYEKIKIQNYLNKKLLSSKIPVVRPVSDLVKISSKLSKKQPKRELLDPSKFQAPKFSFLLVAFWGLYRHEQVQRPLLSLTCRPDVATDKTWSVAASDKTLWNQSCVFEVCECPPMFGYSVPANFFGDLAHLHYTCPVKKIHLNHYSESTEGNEFILTDNWQCSLVDEQPFEDLTVNINIGTDVDGLKDQFETTMSGICDLLTKLADDTDSGTDYEEDEEVDENHYTSLWDDIHSNILHVPISKQSRDSLIDDNNHPLLEVSDICLEEEVPLQVKEMIRRSLSPKKNDTEVDFVCDPPCSVWCDSVNKSESSPRHSAQDAPVLDLISLDRMDSTDKIDPINIILKPVFCLTKMKPGRRSFSVSDCFNEAKPDFIGVTARVSNLTTSKDTFPGKIPMNFLKSCHGSDSWDDADSGFVSSSSQEDIFGGKYEHEDTTWKFVNSENTLWRPLPECVETNDTKMSFPLKLVQNFRHQKSVS